MFNQWKWYVYIIECRDGTYYTGMTMDLNFRYNQHINGEGSKYTKKHGVRKLVYHETYERLDDARYRERQIKDWSQNKKRKLINGEWGYYI